MAPTERRLAAILSADVVGYSRLMAEDEEETVRTMTAYRDIVGMLVQQHRGRVVDSPGDNLLAEFPTATDAVEAATEIQRVIQARNAAVPEPRRMQFRIGVHLGEVRVEGERIYGDGVNVAARLEGLADPGGICISGAVHDQVQSKLDLRCEDLGEKSLKNIEKPVRVFRVREAPSSDAQPSTRKPAARWAARAVVVVAAVAIAVAIYLWRQPSPPTGPPLSSIAVLPFEDMSPGGDQGWLANGMAEELIDALSRIDELRVIARTSAFVHRGEDIATIGDRLQVGALVEGSLRRSGDQLRVTAQLIRVADSSHLWSGSYDRKLSDVFAIQREIAREVAEAIRTELGVGETRSWLVESRYATPDVRAWELLKKAVDYQMTWTEAGFRSEIDLCLQALEIDPDYGPAHAQLGWGYWFLWFFGHDPREENLSKARTAAERALEHDPTNGAAHNLLGWLSMRDFDWAAAEARYVRALEARPRSGRLGELGDSYGWVLLETGRVEEARTQFRNAVRLDPTVGPYRSNMGILHVVTGDFEAAIEEFQRAVDLAWPGVVPLLAYAHHLNGDDQRASEVLIQAAPSPEVAAAWTRAFDEGGYAGIVRAALNHHISQSGRPCANDPALVSTMLAIIGEPDRMFECLNEVVQQRRPPFLAKVWPAYDRYRDDPRFTALLRRMGLED
jgi:class 3 adenylate cyclase/TolB-like protein